MLSDSLVRGIKEALSFDGRQPDAPLRDKLLQEPPPRFQLNRRLSLLPSDAPKTKGKKKLKRRWTGYRPWTSYFQPRADVMIATIMKTVRTDMDRQIPISISKTIELFSAEVQAILGSILPVDRVEKKKRPIVERFVSNVSFALGKKVRVDLQTRFFDTIQTLYALIQAIIKMTIYKYFGLEDLTPFETYEAVYLRVEKFPGNIKKRFQK